VHSCAALGTSDSVSFSVDRGDAGDGGQNSCSRVRAWVLATLRENLIGNTHHGANERVALRERGLKAMIGSIVHNSADDEND
jgi:hypothetical protein